MSLSFTENKNYGFSHYHFIKFFSLGQVEVSFKDFNCLRHFLCF